MRFLITAGPTREFLDPVRYLSNPSSGKMGLALAQAAGRLGHRVHLVHGPCLLPIPRHSRIRAVAVTTCLEMRKEVLEAFGRADIVVMAAAVTDFRAKNPKFHKVKKDSRRACVLKLTPNPDILAELGRRKTRQMLVGFSAETKNLLRHAAEKLRRKKLDCIVANKVGGRFGAFGSNTNRVVVLDREGNKTPFPRMTKQALAKKLIPLFLVLAHNS